MDFDVGDAESQNRLQLFLFYYCMEEFLCCELWTVSGNHTTFGFSQDSLNSMNSAKSHSTLLLAETFP